MTRPLSVWIAATADLLATATPASATEFVTNGGFESDFTGWLLSGSADYAGGGGGMVNSGANAAYFGPVGATASISQVLNTVVGQSYDVSFYLQNSGAGTNSFDVFFGGGAAQISYVDALAMPWTRLSFTGTAVSDLTRSEEHTSELQSLMRISSAVFCLKKKINNTYKNTTT